VPNGATGERASITSFPRLLDGNRWGPPASPLYPAVPCLDQNRGRAMAAVDQRGKTGNMMRRCGAARTTGGWLGLRIPVSVRRIKALGNEPLSQRGKRWTSSQVIGSGAWARQSNLYQRPPGKGFHWKSPGECELFCSARTFCFAASAALAGLDKESITLLETWLVRVIHSHKLSPSVLLLSMV